MLSNIITCFNVVMPLMLVVALGYILHDRGFLSDGFVKDGVKLAFTVGFPCSLINSFSTMNLNEILNTKLLVLIVAVSLVSFAIPMLIVPRFVKDRAIAASMIQSMLRTNVIVQGASLLTNVYGEQDAVKGAFLIPFIVLTNNLLATLIFIILLPHKNGGSSGFADAIKKVITNPLIIGSVVGVALAACNITLPTLVQSTLAQLGKLATPLSLICMGASLRFSTVRSGLKYTIPTVLVRLVAVPAAATLAGIALGFRGIELGSIFLLLSCSSATASFALAQSMGGDTDIAAQSICLSVLFSTLTITAGLFVLLQANLI